MDGGAGDDIVIGGSGNDQMWGEAGSDEFHFNQWSGRDKILDFESGVDALIFDVPGINGSDDLNFHQIVEGPGVYHLVIEYGGNEIVLMDTALWTLGGDDFVFV